MSGVAHQLVLAWGNRARGDDALGPLFAERLRALALPDVEVLDDYQLMPEHALDLVGRERVLFVDASTTAGAPFELTSVQAAAAGWGFSSHAMAPAALLAVYVQVTGTAPPACTLLAIRGERFGLGEGLGAAAREHLAAALDWARKAEGPRGWRAFEMSGGASGI